ncbi:MAG: hypothetical protein ACYDBJ_07250 [Aggregatilineales bacterium]
MLFTEAQLVEFITALEKEIEKADDSEATRNSGEFVLRNLALTVWLLQRRDAAVRRKQLTRLIGKSQDAAVTYWLDQEFSKFVIFSSDSAVVYDRQFINAIGTVFDKPEYQYCLSSPVAAFADAEGRRTQAVKGYQFIEWLSLLTNRGTKATQSFLTKLVVQGFETLLPGVQGEFPYPKYPVARIYRQDGSWNFLLVVMPKQGVLSRSDINAAVAQDVIVKSLLWQDHQLENLNTLLIAPAINREKTARFVEHLPDFYHCWSLSALRFFNELQDLITPGNIQAVSDNFLAIFPAEHESRFATIEALDRLKKKL